MTTGKTKAVPVSVPEAPAVEELPPPEGPPNGTGEHVLTDETVEAAEQFAEAAVRQFDEAHQRPGRSQQQPPASGSTDGLFSADGPAEIHALELWIRNHQTDMMQGAVIKANEYGAGDLEVMAGAMVTLQKNLGWEMGILLAIAFYAQGKVARILSALREGRMPSFDSWRDLEVYAMIGHKVQETGKWV